MWKKSMGFSGASKWTRRWKRGCKRFDRLLVGREGIKGGLLRFLDLPNGPRGQVENVLGAGGLTIGEKKNLWLMKFGLGCLAQVTHVPLHRGDRFEYSTSASGV